MINKKVLAIIPARGASKGVPRKNIIDLCGKPLIGWTLNASFDSTCISKTIVSSDDEEILKIASEYGAEASLRPYELASDEALTVPVVMQVIDSLGKRIDEFEYIALLQPTSPLRTAQHIDQAFKRLIDEDANAIISVVEPNHSPLKSFLEQNGRLKGIVNNEYPFLRRQDLPKTYQANGAIYIINIKIFQKNHSFLTSNTTYYEMDETSSLDIDTFSDLDNVRETIKSGKI